ncbi:MAG: 3-keto-disaccharide hydrolase [Pirellulaceae bacterium]
MLRLPKFAVALIVTFLFSAASSWAEDEKGWVSLFDGKSLDGWKIAENPKAFSVQDGQIVVNGERGHMFYDGEVANHNFKNFELKVELMTTPGSNSGIYFHTKYQERDWPSVGYEVQVNQTHGDPKKSSGLYGVQDVMEAPAKDNEWYTQEIIVKGKHIVTKVNGKTLVDYTEPDDVEGGRKLSSGTIAIQAHDPKSKVFIKSIKVKVLED